MLILLSIHSLWRWIVLLLAIIAIVKALIGWLGNQDWNALDERLRGFYPMAFAIQFLLGLVLYISALAGIYTPIRYLSSSNVILRLSTEHVLMMIIAMVIAMVASGRARRTDDAKAKHRWVALGYIVSLILVFVALIPMPAEIWGFNWYG